MDNVERIIELAEQQCSEHGARLTRKRKVILQGLLSANKALSAYELVDVCKSQTGDELPPMSIYRILNFLVAENLVHKLELANKYIACAHISCSHSHGDPQFLICRQCNKVREVDIKQRTLDDLKLSALNAGFKVVGSQIELNCICDDCA
ncbi:MAG: Fur family transcriptional regulator [Pseudomonadota bacterium]